MEDYSETMMLKRLASHGRDLVHVADKGFARLRNRAGEIIAGRDWGLEDQKSVVEVQGWVKLVMRERGKLVPGSHREGHNIWTNTGREFLAMLMSLETPPMVPFRQDRIQYIGVGIGSQIEDASVQGLVQPVEFSTNLFLATLDIPPSFPLLPTRTTVRYHKLFSESEITIGAGEVTISEIGLFTNGDPNAVPIYNPGSRNKTIAVAAQQAPVAYKTFDPVTKKDSLQLEVSWEIRF
jgi:hypothetical protein